MPKALDISGKRFGRLVVLCRATVPGARNVMWRCQCDCGETTIGAAANIGKTKFSCGCLASENGTKTLRVNRLARTDLHGLSRLAEYRIWSKMKGRCLNKKDPKFHRYGGRGIVVCDRWKDSFENFLEDMGPRPSKRHSIDRIDNNGNYEPGNCRWAIEKVQARNRSTTRKITINGVTLCVREWCETLGVPDWKPAHLVRKRGKKRDLPPRFTSIEDAVRFLHQEHSA